MERYIIREPRDFSDFPQNIKSGNQTATFTRGNNESPDESIFLERPLPRAQNFSHTVPVYMPYAPSPTGKNDFGNVQMNSPSFICLPSGQGPMMSGIDPRYLAAYADPNANFIATGQQMQRERGTISANPSFAGDYQNRMPQERNSMELAQTRMRNEQVTQPPKIFETPTPYQRNSQNNWKPVTNTPIKKPEASDVNKPEIQNQIMSRGDKLKALHRSGARVFSGPVEKVLKWHKALQDIGVYVLYEIVAKCVNIRPGEPCSKNLVVRDESGPAMQIVYYEVDFLLPELKPPCTVRILGRMMSGTSRFQAFSVRPATGDDAAALPRRAAVAAHHVSKLCKEYTV